MTQDAIVTQTFPDGTAEVVVERAAICGGDCQGCDSCMYENTIKTKAINAAGAVRGQLVYLETGSDRIFKATLLIYVLPLVFFFMGYGLGALAGFSQSINVLFSFVFLGIGGMVSWLALKMQHKKAPVQTRITGIKFRDIED